MSSDWSETEEQNEQARTVLVSERTASRDDSARLEEQVESQDAETEEELHHVHTSPELASMRSDDEVEDLLLDPSKQRFPAVVEDFNELPTYPIRPSYRDFHAQLRPSSRCVVTEALSDDPYKPASVPIYQTATFEQPSSVEFGPYDYSRSGNPTRTALERVTAQLEYAHAAFAFSSGMAALNSVTRLLQSGDTMLVGSDIYGGMHRLVNRVTSLYGIKVLFVPTWDLEEVERVVLSDPSIRLCHMETPSNPLMRITDIRALADLLHQHDILLSVDSTMMTPHLQQPLNHGADIVVHSMTKFFGGTSDTSGGITCVANEELAKKIAFFQNAEGTGLSPFDCWLFLRGIKTLAIRVERAQENAQHIAAFLSRNPLVQELYYAGLEPSKEQMRSHKQAAKDFKIHMGQAKGGGSLISFTTGSVEISRRIIDALRLFKLTVSFGSCNSLCEMPATLSHASIPAHMRTLPEDLVRLSIGIEDVNDLIEDLQQALLIAASGQPVPKRDCASSIHKNRVKPELPVRAVSPAIRRSRGVTKLRTYSSKLSQKIHTAGEKSVVPWLLAAFMTGVAFSFAMQSVKQRT